MLYVISLVKHLLASILFFSDSDAGNLLTILWLLNMTSGEPNCGHEAIKLRVAATERSHDSNNTDGER